MRKTQAFRERPDLWLILAILADWGSKVVIGWY
jgi:hypothetical protein